MRDRRMEGRRERVSIGGLPLRPPRSQGFSVLLLLFLWGISTGGTQEGGMVTRTKVIFKEWHGLIICNFIYLLLQKE